MEPDFEGWATKANLKCSDGRTIMEDAFKHQDGMKVPLVWHHNARTDPENVLGHVLLNAAPGGMRVKAFFNENPKAVATKHIVEHEDIESLSIWANELIERDGQVFHGKIHEVSLVQQGANPGAKIDFVRVSHSDDPEDYTELSDTAIITTGLPIEHSQAPEEPTEEVEDGTEESEEDPEEVVEHAAPGDTGRDVYNTLDEDQKALVNYMVAVAAGDVTVEHSDNTDEGDLNHQEGNDDMPRNAFEQNGSAALAHSAMTGEGGGGVALSHEQRVEFATKVYNDFKSNGQTFKSAFLAHAGEYGITNIEALFPDAQAINTRPEYITRKMDWVDPVLNGANKVPFSKLKSASADLTHEDARARGYIKGTLKKEQYFSLAGRKTGPATIYKKQRLDRDDIVDATEFDVVAWLWVEMRFMLREEVARAILIGDGRDVEDPDNPGEPNPDKIAEPSPSGDGDGIRPIAFDDEFYTDVVTVAANVSGQDIVEAIVRKRDDLKGSGSPTAFMTRAVYNDIFLEKDRDGRRLYKNKSEVADDLEVENIVFVPVMADVQTDDGELLMVIVNMADYTIGMTRGGEVTTFDDFDIDYNQYKYLIETRLMGALTRHKSAQVVVRASGTLATPTVPTFNTSTGVLTVPTVTGVVYKNDETDATLSAGAQTAIASGDDFFVRAEPASGYYFPHNFDADWKFTRD